MGIVKLEPAYKDYLWGGDKLKTVYHKKTSLTPLAESWEVSTHPDGESVVCDGPYKGLTLTAYIERKGRTVLGTKGMSFDRFPILVKFIDARDNLSIQVHPDDEYGLKHENEYGKTEMWVILEAEPGAKLYFGTNQEISKEVFAKSIENNTVLNYLNHVAVKKGDVIFVEAKTIHAIGAGIVICEIQQNSNVTYRVYDFDRVGADGKRRELHIDKSIAVANLSPSHCDFSPQGSIEMFGEGTIQTLASCKYFTTRKVVLNGGVEYTVSSESFEALIVLEGTVEIKNGGEVIVAHKGESVFVDADSGIVSLVGNAELLRISV